MQGVLDSRFLSRYIHLPEKVYGIRRLVWMLGILVCIVIGASFAIEQYHIAFGLFAVFLGIGIFLIPYFGILLFIALTYMRPQDHIKSLTGMPVILVVMSLTLGCWLLRLLIFRKREFVKTPHNLFLLGLVLTAMLSCVPIWLATAKDAFMDFFKILLAFFLMINLIDTRRKLDIAVWVVLVGTVYIAALGIFQYYGIAPEITGTILEVDGGRVQGFGIFSSPNYLAYGVLLAVPIAIYAAYYSRFWLGKSLFLLILAVLLYCVYLTGSRGGLLSAVLTVLFCILQDRKPRTILIGAFFGIAILLIMLKSVPGLETVRYYRDDGSAMGRVDSWKAGFDMLSASPLLGVGYKQYIDHWYLDSHNAFVEVGSELGFIGLFIWVGLFYWSYKYLRAAAIQSSTGIGHRWQKAHNKSLKAILFAFAVGSCFASLSYYLLIYIFHSLAVVAGRLYIPEEKGKEISQVRLKDLFSIGGIEVAVLCTWYVFPRL